MFSRDNHGYDLGTEVRDQPPALRPVTRQPSRLTSPPVIKMGSFHMHWQNIKTGFMRSWFCWGDCPPGVQFTDRIVLMEGEIYFRPQLEIIDNGYLSGVQGYFIVNIFRGMGSLIVPSCSPVHRNSPGPVLWRPSGCFWHECAKLSNVQIVFMSSKLCSQNNKYPMKGFVDIFRISNNAVYLFQAFSKIPGATVK